MSSTTYEEACLCPKCGRPGQVRNKKKVRRSRREGGAVEVHSVFCTTELCRWYNTSWLVQVNEDGSIPEPYKQLGPKNFPKLSAESETRVQEALQRQLDAETRPGSEIRNPHG